jgi:hypothetical protein
MVRDKTRKEIRSQIMQGLVYYFKIALSTEFLLKYIQRKLEWI